MSVYYEGRRRVGGFSQSLESGKSKVDVEIFERWIDVDASTTARCGAVSNSQITRSVGLSEKSTHNLKGVIESALGVQGLINLKAQVEELIGHEVSWNHSVSITKVFEYTAPKCGRYTLTIYELSREYQITYSRQLWRPFQPNIWDKKWTRTLLETTNIHDGYPDIEEFDEACNCNKARPSEYDGRLCFDLGKLSFRVPYRLTKDGFEVQIFERLVAFVFANDNVSGVRSLDAGVTILIPINIIPEALVFLGDLNGELLEPLVFRYIESMLDPNTSTSKLDQDTINKMGAYIAPNKL
jgi:hypothetical protein